MGMPTAEFAPGDHVQVSWPDGHLDGSHGDVRAPIGTLWQVCVGETTGLFRRDELLRAPSSATWRCPHCPAEEARD